MPSNKLPYLILAIALVSLVLAEARLPQMFFGACHLSTHVTPGELGDKVRNGLKDMEHKSPEWMHPGNGPS